MIYWLLIIFIVILDQWSKKETFKFLSNYGVPLNLGKRFQLRLAINTGAFYGIFNGKRKLIIVINLATLILCIFLLYLGIINQRAYPYNLGLSFIIGGAVGNLIDRIKKGYVIDFLCFKVKRGPIFNIADIFILTGALMLCYMEIFYGIL